MHRTDLNGGAPCWLLARPICSLIAADGCDTKGTTLTKATKTPEFFVLFAGLVAFVWRPSAVEGPGDRELTR